MKKSDQIKKILIIGLKDSIAYPSDILTALVSGLVFIGIQYFLWQCVYQSLIDIEGFNFKELISYIALVSIITPFLSFSGIERRIQGVVMNGTIGLELLFPFNYQGYCILFCYGKNLFSFMASGIPLFLLSVYMLKLNIPSLSTILIFFVTLYFGFLIGANLSFIIGILAFILKNNEGCIQINKFISGVFSGSLAPLSFFPLFIQKIADVLPFKGIIFIPIQVYFERIQGTYLLLNLLFQVLWILILGILGRLLFEFFRRRIEILGG